MTSRAIPDPASIRLGLRENAAQFSLLVLVNGLVGAMVGMERSILPLIAERDFNLVARTSMLSFIVVFGLTKAVTNYAAGRLADLFGRRRVLIAGWLVAIPIPFLLIWAPTWTWVLVANAFLGVSQDRHPRCGLSCDVGRGSTRDGRAVRSDRPQMADCVRHVDPGDWLGGDQFVLSIRRLRIGRSAARYRYGDGVSDITSGYRGYRVAFVAQLCSWCVPTVA